MKTPEQKTEELAMKTVAIVGSDTQIGFTTYKAGTVIKLPKVLADRLIKQGEAKAAKGDPVATLELAGYRNRAMGTAGPGRG